MKKILTIIALTVAVLGTANAATKNTEVTVLSNIGTFNKIEVHGNVELVVANGDKNAVEMNNNYYAESALVQNDNGTLRITSYNAQKLVVYVTANDLRSIAAYDNASVKSDGKLSLITLDVELHNTAYAGLNLDNYAANITVSDQAKADLTGNITDYSLNYSQSSTVNRAALVAENSSEKLVMPVQVKHNRHSVSMAD